MTRAERIAELEAELAATEAEAVAWRDKKNGAWTGTLVGGGK